MKTIKTYLPVFPGFYNTIFEADESNEIYEINSIRRSKGLPEINYDQCVFDYKTYQTEVCKQACNYVELRLKELDLIHSINMEEIISPREYNFYNDSINIEVNLLKKHVKNIKKYILNNLDEYRKYLKERYTSCSGFWSSYPNNFEGWQQLTDNFTNFEEKGHYLGSILQFICNCEGITDYTISEHVEVYIYALNYSELTEE